MNIAIQTAQNVTIEYELADVGSRIIATIIDLVILGIYYFIVVIVSAQTGTKSLFTYPPLFIVFYLLPPLVYHPLSEILMNGQSLGKKAMSLRVVRTDGYEPDIGSYLLRALLAIVENNMFGVIAIIAIVSNKRGQRIGDMAAGTTVIRLRQRAKLEDTILQVLAADYKPTFTNVTLLTDRDVSLIKELLDNAVRQRNATMMEQLARKVKTILNVDTPVPAMTFLQTVIKDYNYYTGEMT